MVLRGGDGLLNRFIQKFSVWFASPLGVLETAIVIVGIIIVEKVHPSMDPSGFWILYWLTVYSGVTQPILAYAATMSANESGKTQKEIKELQETQSQLLRNNADILRTLIAMSQAMEKDIDEIADDIDDLKVGSGEKVEN